MLESIKKNPLFMNPMTMTSFFLCVHLALSSLLHPLHCPTLFQLIPSSDIRKMFLLQNIASYNPFDAFCADVVVVVVVIRLAGKRG